MAAAPIGGEPYKAAGNVKNATDVTGRILQEDRNPGCLGLTAGPRTAKSAMPGEPSPTLQAAINKVQWVELYASYEGAKEG